MSNSQTNTRNYLGDPEFSFPDTICARLTDDDSPAATSWKARHNRCVRNFGSDFGALTRNERSVLSVMAGINAATQHDAAADPYYVEHFTGPLLAAFRTLLDHDLGRLDGGLLSEWSCFTADRFGWDMDVECLYSFAVKRDGEIQYRADSENSAFVWMQRHTNQSHEWECTHNGWSIEEVTR